MKRLFVLLFAICLMLPLASCGQKTERAGAAEGTEGTEPSVTAAPGKNAPDDFAFFIRWGVYGVSSYDSAEGKLVKTTDTLDGNTDKFVTYVSLGEETEKRFYDMITALDLLSYPSEYDPGCGYSAPSATLELSYTANGKKYRVTCPNISLDYKYSDNAKGREFLNVINTIKDYLTDTPEWKVLPDYEVLYE